MRFLKSDHVSCRFQIGAENWLKFQSSGPVLCTFQIGAELSLRILKSREISEGWRPCLQISEFRVTVQIEAEI